MPRKNAVDILGIGAQKSATSWAAHVLNLHSTVWIPRANARAGKEVAFFDTKWEKGRGWYERIMAPPKEDLKSMDVSPGYATIGPGKVNVCHEISPRARLFLLLRDPVDRDWSSLLMQATRRDFDVKTASFIDLLVFYDKEPIAKYSNYVTAVKNWRDAYKDQLLIGLYDDICEDSHAFYQKLCTHVQLDPDAVADWRTRIEKRIFPGPEIEMPAEIAEYFSRKYKTMVNRLQDLLKRDLSGWKSIKA